MSPKQVMIILLSNVLADFQISDSLKNRCYSPTYSVALIPTRNVVFLSYKSHYLTYIVNLQVLLDIPVHAPTLTLYLCSMSSTLTRRSLRNISYPFLFRFSVETLAGRPECSASRILFCLTSNFPTGT